MMTILPITLTMAGAATLLNLWLAFRVGQVRTREKVLTGDGGHPLLVARMRAHANFVEYTPFFLILLGLVELARGSQTWLWGVGIAFVVGCLMHPFGMDRPAPHPFRMGGTILTWLTLVALAIDALYIPYTQPRLDETIASVEPSPLA